MRGMSRNYSLWDQSPGADSIMISWIGRSPQHFTTSGAQCLRSAAGWYLIWGFRARGPYRDLESAMDAWPKIRGSLSETALKPEATIGASKESNADGQV
jgi:hypothetical protein